MKIYYLLLMFVASVNTLFAQKIPDNFRLDKIIQANDLPIGNPNAVLMTNDLKHLIISYEHKPTYLRVYETQNWEQVNQIEVPGVLYLGQSYIDCDNNELLYGDYGATKPKFYLLNILSDYREKVKPKDLPLQNCGHSFVGKTKLREQQFRIKDQFIIVLNHPKRTIEIFVKKVKRT
ncbi:hypothetical protein [Aureispira anguillae]|uniref:Uncharacterized protein n=1 Tax=Aureispira anguillae TaxID=2864201 RepID=A0A915YI45_9BACT|nr:hypothetical protein [Aureispira anguillae]BDS13432.1 hypothetical protein AsAng_0041690 [Aureispira anguillae]